MRAISLISLVFLSLVAALAPKTQAEAVSGPNNAADFHLKGVLLSKSGRSALVNNTVLREGEQLDGIEILAIEEGEIRIRRGSQELTVWVGTRAHWDLARPHKAFIPKVPPPPAMAANDHVPVQRGDTLSEIAERHLTGDVSRHQMMIALYDANPEAFDGNINLLREGAVLRIPDLDALHSQAMANATEEVLRQTKAWRDEPEQRVEPEVLAAPETYGPVTRGQTLSHIAASLARDGTTMNQMMIALFETNPHAFAGNINLLQVGAVLQVPNEAALLRNSHATATATVINHMDAWRHRGTQQLQSQATADENAAEPPQSDDTVLLSMRGIR